MTPSDPQTAHERGERFRRLHDGPGLLVMPNPWDPGTARLLEHLGFEALGTTSAGQAFAAGHRDGHAEREQVLHHLAAIVGASSLPVSADLEHGYGATPDDVADTVAAVAARGVVGASIEDCGPRRGDLYELERAVDRVAAAVDAARGQPFPFTLTARCECFVLGRPDLHETVRRLVAYQEAGADVLYAPGLRTREQIEAVVGSVDRPVNVVVGLGGEADELGVAALAEVGVRRVSLGSTLARVAFGAFLRAAEELVGPGTFGFVHGAVPYAEIDAML